MKQVSEYAEEAMAWAVGSGILQGMEQNLLAPRGTATRAQAASSILMRCAEA
ncbi:MAG: S-layer homology domain-containing protein [Oscillospiraceae bacterium]